MSILALFPGMAAGDEKVQKQGAASLLIQAGKLENGRLEIRLSEQIKVTVRLEARPGVVVESIGKIVQGDAWDLTKKTAPKEDSNGRDKLVWEQSFYLYPTRPGDVPFDPVPLRYRETSGDTPWTEIRWRPEIIHVVTEIMQADTSELRHHVRPEELPPLSSWRLVLILVGCSVVAALLALAGWSRYRRRQRPVPVMAPHEWMEAELARLEFLPLETSGDLEHYHIRMADMIRRYLQLLCSLPAFELTTPEILAAMDRLPRLSRRERSLLRDLLERCDIAKFAGALPAQKECRQLIELARSLVTEPTTEAPPISEGHGADHP